MKNVEFAHGCLIFRVKYAFCISVTTLKLLRGETNNTDHLATVQCSAGKPLCPGVYVDVTLAHVTHPSVVAD